MKQVIKYISAWSLLLLSMTASAQSTIKVIKPANGSMTVDKESASKGETVTVRVRPNEGYYFEKEQLSVIKTIDPGIALTRADIPVSASIPVSGDAPDDPSQSQSYTFIVPGDHYELHVSAEFMPCTRIYYIQDRISLSATDFAYNGENQQPTVTVEGLTEGIDYTVYFSESSHIDARSAPYTVSISGKGRYTGSVEKNFTISAKTVTNPTIKLSETSYVYDGKYKTPSVIVKDGETVIPESEYQVSYQSHRNVGTATVVIKDIKGGNYNVSGTTTFNITPGQIEYTPPTAKADLEYWWDNPMELIEPGTTNKGFMEYSLDGINYDRGIPEGINAGEYTVYYRIVNVDGYEDVGPLTIKVTIAPIMVNNPEIWPEQSSVEYDGKPKEPVVVIRYNASTVPPEEYTVTYSNNVNVGTATVTITDKEGGNYTVNGTTTFEIFPAADNLTAPTKKEGLIYNGSEQELVNGGNSTTGTLQYSIDGTNYSEDIPTGKDAKEYTVYYRVIGDANHYGVDPQRLKVTIEPKEVREPTIILDASSYTYTGNPIVPTVTVKDGDKVIPASEYTVYFDNNVEVGSHTLEIRDREGGNYVVSGWTYLNIVKAKTPGDANGDGQVTVTDAACIIRHILGETPRPFNTSAADANGDGLITVTDAVKVIDLIQNP